MPDDEPEAWRLFSGHGNGQRPIHESLDCERVLTPDHYRPADPDRENAPWCKVCRGPHECSVCGQEFDDHDDLRGHRATHGYDRQDVTARDLASDDYGPEDLGLSPMGDRTKEAGD